VSRSKNNLSRSKKGGLTLLIVIFLAILIFFLYLVLAEGKVEKKIEAGFQGSVKISLLNGCGYPGIASEVKEILLNAQDNVNEQNLDIIFWKNVERNMFIYKKTIIVVKHNNEEKLKYLMHLTGIKRKIYAFDDNAIEEFQIILGNDYQKYFD